MAALLEAITVKRKMYFEFENVPYYCLEAEVSTISAKITIRIVVVACGLAGSRPQPLDSSFARQPAGVAAG